MKKAKTKGQRRLNIIGWLMNSPYIVFTLTLFLVPLGWAAWLSTMNWNLMSQDRTFVGMANFARLFDDSHALAALKNTFRYMLPIVALCILCGFTIALLVSQLPDKVKGTASVIFFIPYLTSGVATSVVVQYFFSYDSMFNVFLRSHDVSIKWFQNEKAAFAIIVGLIVWKMAGYYALFLLSAIEGIGVDVKEAAFLDGSTGWNRFTHITIPMILPQLTTVIVLATGLSFRIYTEPYLLTGGGPRLSTTSWMLEIYNASFTQFQSGYGAAMAIFSAVQTFITIRIISFAMNKLTDKYGA